MSELFGHVASAALPVAITLLVLTAAARGVLWARLEGDEERLARQYLAPLATWCLIAAGTYAAATGAAGRAGVVSLGAALTLGAAAVLLRSEDTPEVARDEPKLGVALDEPKPDVRRSPVPETLGPETGGRRAFPEPAPAHGRTPRLWVDEDEGPRRGLWAR